MGTRGTHRTPSSIQSSHQEAGSAFLPPGERGTGATVLSSYSGRTGSLCEAGTVCSLLSGVWLVGVEELQSVACGRSF